MHSLKYSRLIKKKNPEKKMKFNTAINISHHKTCFLYMRNIGGINQTILVCTNKFVHTH